MGYWRKPPPETERTHRMGNLTIGCLGGDGGNSLGPGEAEAFYWWISLPFKIPFFMLRLVAGGLIKLIGSKDRIL